MGSSKMVRKMLKQEELLDSSTSACCAGIYESRAEDWKNTGMFLAECLSQSVQVWVNQTDIKDLLVTRVVGTHQGQLQQTGNQWLGVSQPLQRSTQARPDTG